MLCSCCSVAPTTITQVPGIKPSGASNAALHVIGVYEGALPAMADRRPWWGDCQSLTPLAAERQPSAMQDCRAKISGYQEPRSVTVNISDDSSPIILGLMAYESVVWKVHAGPGVVIAKVILAGYHQQQLQGVSDVQVDVFNYENSPCERCVQKGRYFYAYDRVPYEMEIAAGMRASSFQGNYTGGIYQIFKGMQ